MSIEIKSFEGKQLLCVYGGILSAQSIHSLEHLYSGDGRIAVLEFHQQDGIETPLPQYFQLNESGQLVEVRREVVEDALTS